MKKSVIISLIFPVLAVFAVPLFVSASFNHNLWYGMKGSLEVQELQEFLTDQGVYDGPITGNFFSLTLAGVKKFQTLHNISPVSGYFGPLSRGKANDILSKLVLTDESGNPVNPATTTPATTDDVVAKITEQNKLLDEQNKKLQEQNQNLNQNLQNITNQLGAIQQNTTPKPYVPPPVPEVKKEIKIRYNASRGGAGNEFTAAYLENGNQIENVEMILKADDGFTFTSPTINWCSQTHPVSCARFTYEPADRKLNHNFTLSVGNFSQTFNLFNDFIK